MKESFFDELKPELILNINPKRKLFIIESENDLVVPMKSVIISLDGDVIKNGTRKIKIKDIPYNHKKVTLDISKQRFKLISNSNNNVDLEKYSIKCISETHKMTKRLFHHINNQITFMNLKQITNATGVSRAVLYDILNEHQDIYKEAAFNGALYIFKNDKLVKNHWLILNCNNNQAIKIVNNKRQLIRDINTLHPNKIFIPMDLDLYYELRGSEVDDIKIDYFDFINYVSQRIFYAYKQVRKEEEERFFNRYEKDLYQYSLEQEQELFLQSEKNLSKSDLQLLNDIEESNNLFQTYYLLKESILNNQIQCIETNRNNFIKNISLNMALYAPRKDFFDINELFNIIEPNEDIVSLIGLFHILQKGNIQFISLPSYYEEASYFMNDYKQNYSNLIDLQFPVRWNNTTEDKKR